MKMVLVPCFWFSQETVVEASNWPLFNFDKWGSVGH